MPLVDLIAGARPNFMKIAPIIRAIRAEGPRFSKVRLRLIHTGQHYDPAMSGEIFTQLGIPDPDINLEVGSGTQAQQAAGIMVRYEEVLLRERADLCIVVGDVTSTMACAITARKLGVSVAHVEGGLRSGDWTMPEEINRVVTDSISNWFFTTTESAGQNLMRSGIEAAQIFLVGNTMIDTLLANMHRLEAPLYWNTLDLQPGRYLVATLHRPANVDTPGTLGPIISALSEAARGEKVIFPVHPRTSKTLEQVGALPSNIITVEPQPYLALNYLVKNARAVVTDSGGITEETTVMGVPCITMRTSTERPETVDIGTNEVIGTDPAALRSALDRVFDGKWKRGRVPQFWDGMAATRIAGHVATILGL